MIRSKEFLFKRAVRVLGTAALLFTLQSGFSAALILADDVLIVGDSQSYTPFGKKLRKALVEQSGLSVSYYSRPGSVGQNWLDGTVADPTYPGWNAPWGRKEELLSNGPPAPKLSELLTEHRPRLVVFQLGGNMSYQSEAAIRNSITQMVELTRKANAQCLWLGPPPGKKRPPEKFAAFYSIAMPLLEQLGCAFLDTRKAVSAPQTGDGIHLHENDDDGKKQIQSWINQVKPVIDAYCLRSQSAPNCAAAQSETHEPIPKHVIPPLLRPFEIPK